MAGITIFDQGNGLNRAIRLEQAAHFILCDADAQIADVRYFSSVTRKLARELPRS